ncbi:hypothetical protein BGM19_09965 [Streptomyces agglomeratus]|nr:hypothetical protein BGM19_09965 [Streptomyces agglomeratus]
MNTHRATRDAELFEPVEDCVGANPDILGDFFSCTDSEEIFLSQPVVIDRLWPVSAKDLHFELLCSQDYLLRRQVVLLGDSAESLLLYRVLAVQEIGGEESASSFADAPATKR